MCVCICLCWRWLAEAFKLSNHGCLVTASQATPQGRTEPETHSAPRRWSGMLDFEVTGSVRVLGGLPLGVVEVGRHCDYRVLYVLAEEGFGPRPLAAARSTAASGGQGQGACWAGRPPREVSKERSRMSRTAKSLERPPAGRLAATWPRRPDGRLLDIIAAGYHRRPRDHHSRAGTRKSVVLAGPALRLYEGCNHL